MDTFAEKTRAGSSFASWQSLAPAVAARELHDRLATLPAPLRRAAVAWIRPETELAAALSGADSSRPADQADGIAPGRVPAANQPLRGVPFAVKDLFDLAGVPTLAGSTFLPEVRPTPETDSALVRRFTELGAVAAAKSHLVEFASGLTGENPHYGDCPHPRFPDRLTGGSSSGSAALVAAGVLPLALATDTGGSVRVPAAWCGVYGFRLIPGDEFIRDAFPLAPTLDTAGWFTGEAADMLTVWTAITGGRASGARPRGCYLPMSAMIADPDREVAAACDAAAARLCPVADSPTLMALRESWHDAVDAYLAIGMTEAFAVHRDWLGTYKGRYDPVIWQRFTDAGTWPPQRGIRARAVLETVRMAWRDYFAAFDFLVLPAVPSPAPRKAEATPELRKRILALTAPASLGGLPCLTIPVPLPSGLTAGLQVIVPRADSEVIGQILSSLSS